MKLLSTILFVIILTTLTGCDSTQEETMDLLNEKISSIEISKSIRTGEINHDVLKTLKDQQSINRIEKAIRTAITQPSHININETTPDFDMIVNYAEGYPSHPIHIWLGEEGTESTLTYIFGEKQTYVTTVKSTNELREILLSFK
ncbi:hypothetical protein [Alkalihalobacterium elongatum]|uniref:hypothetical protein n=1 Tax=Alkalihalobacterium elongatum TaxID=2675466 RepID=UPI001C20122D|nr:hypothetical protein [Alkalihalobacterium elongatum]